MTCRHGLCDLRFVEAFKCDLCGDLWGGYCWCYLELAVLALARIMCANIHSQNGTAILAQELLSRK